MPMPLILLALVAVLAACASPAPPSASAVSIAPQPARSSQPPVGEADPLAPPLAFLRYSCDGHPFALDLLSAPAQAEFEDHLSAAAFRAFLASGEARHLVPARGWYLAGRDLRTASYVAGVEGDPPFASVNLEIRATGWEVVGYGECRPQLALEGMNPVIFEFADEIPGPDATQIEVEASELSCASGRPVGARLQPAQIIETPPAVYVLLTATTQAREQDCPGHRSTSVTLVLSAPLGDRQLLDVGVFPFHNPAEPWPPG
jgi:hypothetical protein